MFGKITFIISAAAVAATFSATLFADSPKPSIVGVVDGEPIYGQPMLDAENKPVVVGAFNGEPVYAPVNANATEVRAAQIAANGGEVGDLQFKTEAKIPQEQAAASQPAAPVPQTESDGKPDAHLQTPRPDTAEAAAPTPPEEKKIPPEQERIEKLLKNNPFGTSAAADAARRNAAAGGGYGEAPKGLELRGICCVDKKWFFSVSDSAAKANYLIPLRGEITDKLPYKIDFYDDETNSVSISNVLGSYTLSLKVQDPPSGPAPSAAGATAKKPDAKKANIVATPVKGGGFRITIPQNATNRRQSR